MSATAPLRACPMCKDSSVTADKPAATETAGLEFNKSIYVMLGGFAGLLGITGRVIYRAAKSPSAL